MMQRYYIYNMSDLDAIRKKVLWCTQQFGNQVSFVHDYNRITYQTYKDIIFDNAEDYTFFILKWAI